MPTYEYLCQSCGETLEVVQRMTDPPRTECPACGGVLRKVFHPAGIMFKGSGFYATDNRSKPKGGSERTDKSDKSDKTPAKKDSSGSGSSGGASDGKTDGGSSGTKGSGVKPAGAGTAGSKKAGKP